MHVQEPRPANLKALDAYRVRTSGFYVGIGQLNPHLPISIIGEKPIFSSQNQCTFHQDEIHKMSYVLSHPHTDRHGDNYHPINEADRPP